MWAETRADYRTDLVVFDGYVNADVYVDEVLRAHVVPFFREPSL